MSDENEQRGGFGRGRGRGRRGDRGRGGERGDRGGERRGGRGRGGDDDKEWVPVTKLGRLVKARLIKSIEEIYLFSIPIKEYQIIDYFFPGDKLKEEVMKVMPVQKQTKAGQRTRFKAFIALGDMDGHVGLGTKCASELAIAIRGAIIASKLSVRPVRRGYWGNKVGLPHTVPCKVTGKCGSVRMRLIPAPRGTGLVAAVASKKMLSMAGIHDVYTSANGHTRTMGNFIQATFNALQNTYGYLSPELWGPTHFFATPFQEQSDFLAQDGSKASKRANYED